MPTLRGSTDLGQPVRVRRGLASGSKAVAMVSVALVLGATAPSDARMRYHFAHHRDSYAGDYYRLPFSGRLAPGTGELLRPHYDDAYPLHEFTPGGTATGGPVGGLGS